MNPSAFLHPYAKPAKTGFRNLVRGAGSCVWDDAGNRYVDGMASLWYCQVGHGRDRMVEAVASQMQTLATYNTFDPWTNEPAERLAARIAALAPIEQGRVFFTSSGSEAVDSAIKLARLAHARAGHPERTIIVSREKAYHGVTYGGLSVQGLPVNQEGYGELLGGVENLPHHDIEAMAALFAERGDEIAAVITEPVQGAGGVYPPAPGYLEGLRRLCDDHGALLIFDEVICGFGRLGRWFAAERYGVTPDLITFAKGVSSGYVPLGGVVCGRAVCDPLEADPDFVLRHGHTYSGHPTACAAGLESIAISEDEDLCGRADEIGKLLGDGLRSLADDGILTEVRGDAAIWAAELPEGVDAAAVRDGMLERGVIARPLGNAIAFCPPLVITEAEVGEMVDALAAAARS
ncbi:MAG: aminotransferase class III-fold pyridoxal phosphate-dependent enzyme [Actinomycetota bacterium]|nr:aminotransferase class III-fold pyridoxal phosphate-dependent enzyme [Actinomycetota bacterium]